MTNNIQNLPPELQQRIAQIIAQGQANGQPQKAIVADAPPPVPAPRPPSLMDHVIALRQEVAQLSQMVQAQGQVTEAVGNAVGQIYSMFHETSAAPTYSSTFEAQAPSLDDDY